MYKEVHQCRICGNKNLIPIIDLGEHHLTSLFPRTKSTPIPLAPLTLIKCSGNTGCGFVQLKHTVEPKYLYTDNYGYRSGLNITIVNHLKEAFKYLTTIVSLKDKDLIIDIGSNDGTFLNFFEQKYDLLGIDPLIKKFENCYTEGTHLISDFFTEDTIHSYLKNRRAKIITSFSMFYDVDNPLAFMKTITESLANNGVWLLEQNYLPTMLKQTAYDTICHEHIGYYCLKQIQWMADKVDLKVVDVFLTDLNGGSFSVTLAHKSSSLEVATKKIENFVKNEEEFFNDASLISSFTHRVAQHKIDMKQLLKELKHQNKKVVGFGASTKGNVILQYCQVTPEELTCIVEVNEEKFDMLTPGTHIPIVSQEKLKDLNPDYILVLPWHLKNFILKEGARLFPPKASIIFTLPNIEIAKNN